MDVKEFCFLCVGFWLGFATAFWFWVAMEAMK